MALYIYSPESLPNPTLMAKSHQGYTPEYLHIQAITIPLKAGEWAKVPSTFRVFNHADWKDHGHYETIATDEHVERLRVQWGDRGVTFLTHDPTADERRQAEIEGVRRNKEWRMGVVRQYEAAVREREITGTGRSSPTPYEDECYTILGLPKPYSVEAMRAQRLPGEDVAQRLATSMERGMDALVERLANQPAAAAAQHARPPLQRPSQ